MQDSQPPPRVSPLRERSTDGRRGRCQGQHPSAIGTAAVTTIAATATATRLTAHSGTAAAGDPTLTHGFAAAFYVLAAVAAAGAVISALLVESRPATATETATQAEAALEAA